MITLAFDGTAKCASCAVLRDGICLGEYNIDNGLTQSELLLPMAESLLRSLKLTFADIDLYATSKGPGSFTGVRIGTALIKGLAFGRDVPCIGVSTLEALAENARGLSGIIVAAMDARRTQVYTALFRCDGKDLVRLCDDAAMSLSELSEMLTAYKNENIYIVGDGYSVVHKYLTECGVRPENTPQLLRNENARSVALVAERMYANGDRTSDREFAPSYLRLPQAERERLERNKQ